MAEIQIRPKGWMIIPAILLLIGIGAWQHHSLQGALAGEIADAVRERVASEIARDALPATEAAMERGNAAHAAELVDQFVSSDEIDLMNARTKGLGDQVLVRFEIEVRGGTPSSGPAVRYYELERVLGEWRVKRERTRWSWYLKLF